MTRATASVQTSPGTTEAIATPAARSSQPMQEAHWQGLEVIPLTRGLATTLKIPAGVKGVLADDVTLLAFDAGILAGDVITSVGQMPTPTLEDFVQATARVRERRRVPVRLLRRSQLLDLLVTGPVALGTAQGEAAPMIPPGSVAPHRYQGPCTSCHKIGNTGQLAVDQGDLLAKTAPPIRATDTPPHRDRGVCASCHRILP